MDKETRNLFQMKSKPHGIERFNEFIGTGNGVDPFVAIGWPYIGDLTNASKDQIRELLIKEYNYQGRQLATYLGAVNAFVNTMKSGDIVLILYNSNQVYVFEVDHYRYVEKYDNKVDGMCHQREARLLKVINKSDLNLDVQDLLRNRATITQFKYPYNRSGLDKFLEQKELEVNLDRLVNIALSILEKELASNDPVSRIKAAAEILRYAKKFT